MHANFVPKIMSFHFSLLKKDKYVYCNTCMHCHTNTHSVKIHQYGRGHNQLTDGVDDYILKI